MTRTEKELFLFGLFGVVAVNKDSTIASMAILSYKHILPRGTHSPPDLFGISTRYFAVNVRPDLAVKDAQVPLDKAWLSENGFQQALRFFAHFL